MINWLEALALVEARELELSRSLQRAELERLQFLESRSRVRRPVRARLAAALVRIGARLDPATVVVSEGEALTEGSLAAYLR